MRYILGGRVRYGKSARIPTTGRRGEGWTLSLNSTAEPENIFSYTHRRQETVERREDISAG